MPSKTYRAWEKGKGSQHTELGRPLAVRRRASPVIRPRNIPIRAQRNHRLNRKGHPGLRLAGRLVLRVVRHVGRAVEERVDAVPAVRPDGAAAPGLGVLLDDVAELPDRGPRLDGLYREVEALAGGLDHPHRVGVRPRLVAHVVRLVQVAVVALMVEGDVEVEDVPVEEDALVWDAVADDFVWRGAD